MKGFSTESGEVVFVTPISGQLAGPMGLLIAGQELIVVNQNVSTDPSVQPNGEILQFQLKNGSFAGAWVPSGDSNAPFAPRGAVLKDGFCSLDVSNAS